MIKFLKDSKDVFKGNWRNVIMASMMFYIIVFACVMLTVKLPVHIVIKCIIGIVLFTFVVIPLVHGYIRFFINLVNGKEKVNPFILIVPSLEVSPATKIILITTGIILVVLFMFAGGGIFVASFVVAEMRLYVILVFLLLWLALTEYVCYKLWPLFYMVIENPGKSVDFYLNKCAKLTKGRIWEYFILHLKHLPLFIVCLLPAFLGLLVFYPVYILSKYRYFCEISQKNKKN